MRSAFIQSGLCFLSSLAASYLLIWTGYGAIIVLSQIILITSLLLIIFYSKNFILSGVLTGALAGAVNLTLIFSTPIDTWWFLLYAGILALISSMLYLFVFLLSDRLNLRDLYQNGAIIPSIAFISGLIFLVIIYYAFEPAQILFLRNGGLFNGTDVWHFLIIPVSLLATYTSFQINRRVDSIYNQYGLILFGSLSLLGGTLLIFMPVHGSELVLAWLAGLFIGITRLVEYGSLKQFLSATALFGLFFILFRNLFVDLPATVGFLAFISVWIVQQVIPNSEPKANLESNLTAGTNLSSIESYYQTNNR